MPHRKTFDKITLPRNRTCAIFSGKWNSPRAFLWYVDGFCIHFCRSPGRKRGKSSCILRYQESHSSTFIHIVLISPGKSPRVFCITKKAIYQIFIEQEIHMSPCKTGFNKLVKNCSNRILSDPELSVLAKGLNIDVTPAKLPIVDIVTTTEIACRNPGGGALTLERGMGMCRGHDPPFSGQSPLPSL